MRSKSEDMLLGDTARMNLQKHFEKSAGSGEHAFSLQVNASGISAEVLRFFTLLAWPDQGRLKGYAHASRAWQHAPSDVPYYSADVLQACLNFTLVTAEAPCGKQDW